MTFALRPYQSQALDDLWAWFHKHPQGNPIVEAAVGAGKSVMIAALARRVNAEAPGTRVLVLVHQRELLDQNLSKLKAIWPDADAGVISASHGKRQISSQIIFATIGSIYKIAHELGHIGIVLADESHLIQTKEQGMWRAFLRDLFRLCPHTRIVGWTGTPFRGNGVWLTAGNAPLFTHIGAKVTMRKLLEEGFLSPLVPAPTRAKINANGVKMLNGDYVVSELSKVTNTPELVAATCDEMVKLGEDRKHWLVFAVTVEHAENVAQALQDRGINARLITGETPKAERAQLIEGYKTGRIHALVNVAVLTTGFDAPETDFLVLLRATKSPVLYTQILGRGMRLADGKTECLVADFTDTIATLGPVDAIKGREPSEKGNGASPFKLCQECGSRNAAGAAVCSSCGYEFPPPERIKHGIRASDAPIMAHQIASRINTYPVTDVSYHLHTKPGSPPSVRVDYLSGLRRVASEWVCVEHTGFARAKAEGWMARRGACIVGDCQSLLAQADTLIQPAAITVNETGKYPEIIRHHWEPLHEPDRADQHQNRIEEIPA